MNISKKCAVLVSGGVDSSVALLKIKQLGYDVTAFYLKIWLEDELTYLGNCPWEEDLSYVKSLCSSLNVPLEIIPLQQQYYANVVKYTVEEIKRGYTPNPDMLCNKTIKLGAFYDIYGSQFDYIATGHYARNGISQQHNEEGIFRAYDEFKDQTYFLAFTPYDRLKKVLFPLGTFIDKSEVRKYAHDHKIITSNRPDSQGICFLGKIPFSDFINHYCGTKKGFFIDFETKKIIGEHNGFWFYTYGQRQGIGLSGGPWYVVSKDIINNYVYISKSYFDNNKQRNTFVIQKSNFNWLTQYPLVIDEPIHIKLRHGKEIKKGFLTVQDNLYIITLELNDQGIAPGQFAVLYSNEKQCLGSGIMEYLN